jgi:hypothetical protein
MLVRVQSEKGRLRFDKSLLKLQLSALFGSAPGLEGLPTGSQYQPTNTKVTLGPILFLQRHSVYSILEQNRSLLLGVQYV